MNFETMVDAHLFREDDEDDSPPDLAEMSTSEILKETVDAFGEVYVRVVLREALGEANMDKNDENVDALLRDLRRDRSELPEQIEYDLIDDLRSLVEDSRCLGEESPEDGIR